MEEKKSKKQIRKEQNKIIQNIQEGLKAGKYTKEDLPKIQKALSSLTEVEEASLLTCYLAFSILSDDRQNIINIRTGLSTKNNIDSSKIVNYDSRAKNISTQLSKKEKEDQTR